MAERADWFANCTTVAAIKHLYRELAKKWHPDLGGDTATMQSINAAYERALEHCDGETYVGDDNENHTYHFNAAVERDLMAKIAELLKMRMAGVNILLIGTWIWTLGNTRPYKDELKAAGMWWNHKRQAWSYHVGKWHGGQNPGGLDSIARTYGVREFENEPQEALG